MHRRSNALLVITLTLFGLLNLSFQADAATRGGVCKTVGQIQITKKIKYKCTKSGKTLKWVLVKKSTITTSTTIPVEDYVEPTISSSSPELCKLPDQSFQRRTYPELFSAFPPRSGNFERTGTFKVALVPIDWADLPGEANPLSRVTDQMRLFTDYWDMVSEGRVKFEWTTYDKWVRIPGSSATFSTPRSSIQVPFLTAALAAADPLVDFTGIRAVYFLAPKDQTVFVESAQSFFGSTPQSATSTNEGFIGNSALAGQFFDLYPRTYWSYWVHETGHMFYLPDLFDQSGQYGAKQLPIPGGPFSGFDMMATQDGPSRTLSAWLRWIMGWMSDSQLLCKPAPEISTMQAMLVPIDNRIAGLKSIMIPVTDTKLIAIESRRPSRFDCETTPVRNGIIVYTVDTTLGHGEGMQQLVAPQGRGLIRECSFIVPPQYDAMLKVGDSVTVEGVTIKLIKSNVYDTVLITK